MIGQINALRGLKRGLVCAEQCIFAAAAVTWTMAGLCGVCGSDLQHTLTPLRTEACDCARAPAQSCLCWSTVTYLLCVKQPRRCLQPSAPLVFIVRGVRLVFARPVSHNALCASAVTSGFGPSEDTSWKRLVWIVTARRARRRLQASVFLERRGSSSSLLCLL